MLTYLALRDLANTGQEVDLAGGKIDVCHVDLMICKSGCCAWVEGWRRWDSLMWWI